MKSNETMIRRMLNEITRDRFRSYLVGFTRNIFSSFKLVIKPKFVPIHILAIVITIPLVVFGVDWWYFVLFRQNSYLMIFLFPAVPIGSFVPIFLPALVFLYGIIREIDELKYFAYSLTQVAVVGLFWSGLYKSFTGRKGPEFDEYMTGISDYSTEFSFGFLIGGVFDGWPSGHTTIAVALGLVFYQYNLKSQDEISQYSDWMAKILNNRWIGIPYAIYVAFGVSTNIHWLTDAIAGLLIGYCVAQGTLESTHETFSTDNSMEKIDEEINKGNFDKQVRYTFYIIFLTIIFSIIVPREIFNL